MKNKNTFILIIAVFCAIFNVIYGENYLEEHFDRVYASLSSQEKEKFPTYVAKFLNKHRFAQNIGMQYKEIEKMDSALDSIGLFPTHGSLVIIGGAIVHSKVNNSFTAKLDNSAYNGASYAQYYNKSKNLDDFYIPSALLRQVCYVPVYVAVSEGLDKVAESESVQYLGNNISEKNKKLLKQNLSIALSAVAVDSIERLTRKDYSSVYNKPMPSLVTNHLINEGIKDFVIEPYIVQPLGGNTTTKQGIRLIVTVGAGYYIAPYVAQGVKAVLG